MLDFDVNFVLIIIVFLLVSFIGYHHDVLRNAHNDNIINLSDISNMHTDSIEKLVKRMNEFDRERNRL